MKMLKCSFTVCRLHLSPCSYSISTLETAVSGFFLPCIFLLKQHTSCFTFFGGGCWGCVQFKANSCFPFTLQQTHTRSTDMLLFILQLGMHTILTCSTHELQNMMAALDSDNSKKKSYIRLNNLKKV